MRRNEPAQMLLMWTVDPAHVQVAGNDAPLKPLGVSESERSGHGPRQRRRSGQPKMASIKPILRARSDESREAIELYSCRARSSVRLVEQCP